MQLARQINGRVRPWQNMLGVWSHLYVPEGMLAAGGSRFGTLPSLLVRLCPMSSQEPELPSALRSSRKPTPSAGIPLAVSSTWLVMGDTKGLPSANKPPQHDSQHKIRRLCLCYQRVNCKAVAVARQWRALELLFLNPRYKELL